MKNMHFDVSFYAWDSSETTAKLLAGFCFKIFLEIQRFAKYKIMRYFGAGCRRDALYYFFIGKTAAGALLN